MFDVTMVGLYLMLCAAVLHWCQMTIPRAVDVLIGDSLFMVFMSVLLFPLAVLLLVLIHRCQQGEQADAPQGE
ncbi:hypothetical protein [endosymbiont of Riftia pachyptila]|nr:hypothetical protein [endosymbiont of Riftia pachyptila]